MPTDMHTHAMCHLWEFLTHIQTSALLFLYQRFHKAPLLGHTELQSSTWFDCCFTGVFFYSCKHSVLVQKSRQVIQAYLINTVPFLPCITSLYLSYSLHLDLNLQVYQKKGSSSECSASYSKAARYSCMLRGGL